jgi:hypothetical protein
VHLFADMNCIYPPAESTVCPAEGHARRS